MRVLVTRPREDAIATADRLATLGHHAVIAPMLHIVYRDGAAIALDNVQGIVVTSANGIRALARRSAVRTLPVFAVGDQSARAAHQAGYQTVKSADGDAAALAASIETWAAPASGVLLHAAGSQTSGNLAERLGARGYRVRSEVLYDAHAERRFSASTARALSAGMLDAVLFYSPRTAKAFAACVQAEGLEGCCRAMRAVCISQATAAVFTGIAFGEMRLAARPNEDALLEKLTA